MWHVTISWPEFDPFEPKKHLRCVTYLLHVRCVDSYLDMKQDPLMLWVEQEGIFYPDTAEKALLNPYYLWEFLEKTEWSIANGNIWLMTGVTDKVQLMSSEIHTVIRICAYDICGNSHLYIQFTQFNGGSSGKRWDEWREKQRTRCGGREAMERLTDYKSRLIRLQS